MNLIKSQEIEEKIDDLIQSFVRIEAILTAICGGNVEKFYARPKKHLDEITKLLEIEKLADCFGQEAILLMLKNVSFGHFLVTSDDEKQIENAITLICDRDK